GDLARGEIGWLFPVRVPVIRDDRVAYVLSAIITPASLSAALTRGQGVPDEWVRGTVDRNGLLVSRSRDLERYVGQPASTPLLAAMKAAGQTEGIFANL